MGESIYKSCMWGGIDIQNVQTTPTTQPQVKKATQLKNGQRTWTDFSPVDIQMANKDTKRHSTSPTTRKCKSKAPGDTTSHPLGGGAGPLIKTRTSWASAWLPNAWWEHCAAWWECTQHSSWQALSRITTLSSNSTSGYRPKRVEIKVSKRFLYTRVHNRTIHNG